MSVNSTEQTVLHFIEKQTNGGKSLLTKPVKEIAEEVDPGHGEVYPKRCR